MAKGKQGWTLETGARGRTSRNPRPHWRSDSTPGLWASVPRAVSLDLSPTVRQLERTGGGELNAQPVKFQFPSGEDNCKGAMAWPGRPALPSKAPTSWGDTASAGWEGARWRAGWRKALVSASHLPPLPSPREEGNSSYSFLPKSCLILGRHEQHGMPQPWRMEVEGARACPGRAAG